MMQGDQASSLVLRPAQRSDVGLVLRFIRELADFEKRLPEVTATEALLTEHLFGSAPAAEVVFAFSGPEPVGFAVYHRTFSTFLGKPGLYVEDVFVRPAHRSRGVGRELMSYVARRALEQGEGRLTWSVLHWNGSAIRFYEALGAERVVDWQTFRLYGAPLRRLAEAKQDG